MSAGFEREGEGQNRQEETGLSWGLGGEEIEDGSGVHCTGGHAAGEAVSAERGGKAGLLGIAGMATEAPSQ